jgi:hypothetical protein
MTRPLRLAEDSDLVDGAFLDNGGRVIGPLILAEPAGRHPDSFLVIPDEDLPLVHVEAAFENDHRVSGYEQVIGLIYDRSETPSGTVAVTGDRWDGAEVVIYTFETDEDADEARQPATEP